MEAILVFVFLMFTACSAYIGYVVGYHRGTEEIFELKEKYFPKEINNE